MTEEKIDPKIKELVANLRYDLYDPAHPTPAEKEVLDELPHWRAFHANTMLFVSDFGSFSLLNEEGWPRICYQSHLLTDGAMYWITDHHAEMIGKALRPSLKDLTIELSKLEGDGFSIMAANVAADVRLDHLYISHQSGDEVTQAEARGLARLATRLQVTKLHLWAFEYVPGALDVLAQELTALSNGFLIEADICDVSKPEPEDRIADAGLEALIARNRPER